MITTAKKKKKNKMFKQANFSKFIRIELKRSLTKWPFYSFAFEFYSSQQKRVSDFNVYTFVYLSNLAFCAR